MSLTLATLLISALASADPPTFAHNSTPLGDAVCVVRIDLNTPYAPGPSEGLYRVSGTDCNFTIGTPSIVHDEAVLSIVESSLTIGGVAITVPSQCKGAAVRFASTHFPDSNDDLTITWKCKFRYEDPVHNFSGTSDWVSVDFHVNPYNKGLVFGTRMLNSTTESDAVKAFSILMVGKAKPPAEALGHTLEPTDPWIHESDLLTKLDGATFIFATTHGGTTYFNDSYSSTNNAAQTGHIGLSEVNSTTQGRTGNNIPKFNYAMFYSCETLIIPPSTSPFEYYHFGTRDSVYFGFEKKVGAGVALGNTDQYVLLGDINGGLYDHVEALMTNWGGDSTAELALSIANTSAMPRGAPVPGTTGPKYPAVEMKFRGDSLCTIHWVYLTQAERNVIGQDVPEIWYHVWPSP